eukprot:Sdes_comp20935_c0_seq3m18387
MRNYLVQLASKKDVIYTGDLNVAHKEIDLKNPKGNVKNAGFTIEERNGFTELLSKGFVDTFRHFYPDAVDQYTFWSARQNSRAKNNGWYFFFRLDFVMGDNIHLFFPTQEAGLFCRQRILCGQNS